jgi:hypothetical protein
MALPARRRVDVALSNNRRIHPGVGVYSPPEPIDEHVERTGRIGTVSGETRDHDVGIALN